MVDAKRERAKQIVDCHVIALRRLRLRYEKEYREILREVQRENGVIVRERLTGALLRERKIAEARAFLDGLPE